MTVPVNAALTQAEDSTEGIVGRKVVPDDVIFALTGRATVGKLFTVQQTRPKPAEPITAKELANLRARVNGWCGRVWPTSRLREDNGRHWP